MTAWIIAALLFAANVPQPQKPADQALEHLAKIDRFAFGGVGYAGTTSEGEKDYNLILAGPSAEADFEKLYSIGNLQAKCYALVGLRKLDRERFEELATSLQTSTRDVLTQSGCLVFPQPLRLIVDSIRAGVYPRAASR